MAVTLRQGELIIESSGKMMPPFAADAEVHAVKGTKAQSDLRKTFRVLRLILCAPGVGAPLSK